MTSGCVFLRLVALFACIACPLVAQQQTRSVYRLGDAVRASDKQPGWSDVTFLLGAEAPRAGHVFALSGFFCSSLPVHFQLWRPRDVTSRRYTMVEDWRITPTTVNQTQVVYLAEAGLPCAVILPGDRLGLYFAESPGSVPYRFDVTTSGTYSYDSRDQSAPRTGDTVEFESLGYPYAFSAAAHISVDTPDTDANSQSPGCPSRLTITGHMRDDAITQRPTEGTTSPKPTTQPVVTMTQTPTPKVVPTESREEVVLQGKEAERVVAIGNDVRPARRLAEWDNFTYLLGGAVPAEGVVFALSAYFVTSGSAHFQIWRPTDMGGRNFQLVQDWPVAPSVVNSSELIYLSQMSLPCSRVYPGDRLGVYFPEVPGSVPFHFSTSPTQTFTFNTRGRPYPLPGQRAQFDDLALPYFFSAQAYIDTDMMHYPGLSHSPTCLPSLDISGHTSATQRTTTTTSTTYIPSTSRTTTRVTKPEMTSPTDGPDQGGGSKSTATPGGDSGADNENAIAAKLESYVGLCDWCWHLLSPYVTLAILVWLLLLTVAMVTAVCVRSCRRKSAGDLYLRNSGYGTMPSDVWNNYFTNSLSSKQDKKSFIVEPTYSHIEEERTAF